jgi:hypothetical protein
VRGEQWSRRKSDGAEDETVAGMTQRAKQQNPRARSPVRSRFLRSKRKKKLYSLYNCTGTSWVYSRVMKKSRDEKLFLQQLSQMPA